jgi:hypothetical protein
MSALMAALIGSGKCGQTDITSRNSGFSSTECAKYGAKSVFGAR